MANQNDNHAAVSKTLTVPSNGHVVEKEKNNGHVVEKEKKVQRSDFAIDFVFGSATSAYQIEGGAGEGGKGLSIWDAYTLNKPGEIYDGSNGNVASKQYFMFKEDVKLMKKTGLDAYRFSISWSRVLPGGKLSTGVNKEGIKYYNDLIDAILAAGMQPYATLFHWDLPLALELEYGGFLDKKIVDDFRDFAELCFWEFGDRVQHWITINEAWTYAVKGYVKGSFPPGRGHETPSEIEKLQMASIASRLYSVLDVINIPPELKEVIDDLKLMLPKALQKILENISLRKIEKFVTNEIAPLLKSHPSLQGLVDRIRDFLLGFYVEYKGSKKAQACSEGHPGEEPYKVAHNLLLAHATVVDLYRRDFQKHQGGKIGMTNNVNFYLPYDENKQEDKDAAARALDFMFYWFVHPLVTGEYPSSMRERLGNRLPTFSDEEIKLVKRSYDFLGVNYYTTYYAINMPKPTDAPAHYDIDQEVFSTAKRCGVPIGPMVLIRRRYFHVFESFFFHMYNIVELYHSFAGLQFPQAGSDWLYIYPKGFYGLLMDIKGKYESNPVVYITENGVDEKANMKHTVREARRDPTRVKYHNDHIYYMKKAINKGANVKAYFIWSFADNFEWAEGYDVRFGIFYVDFVNGRLTRYPKSSAIWWMNFLGKCHVQSSLKRVYDDSERADEVHIFVKKGRASRHKLLM